MSRTWSQWLSRWKSNLSPNRRPIRRGTTRAVLRTEMLETRATPAVIYGMGLGRTVPPSEGGGGVIIPPGGDTHGDTLPPHITLTQTPGANATLSTNPTIKGVLVDNLLPSNQLTVTVDSNAPVNVPFDPATGQFQFTTTFATNGTNDGAHTLTFKARDGAGNNAPQQVVTFTLASSPLTVDLDAASDTGVQGNHTTTQSTVTLSGKAPANQQVTLVQTGATATADANGNYSFTNVNLASGANTFTVRATVNGNQVEATQKIILDAAPTVAAPVTNFGVAAGTDKSFVNLPTVFSDVNVNSLVRFVTNRGTIDIELFDQQVGTTVGNFLKYVTDTTTSGGDYSNTIFHRKTTLATDGIAVLQGGGFEFTQDASGGHLTHIPTDPAIALQAGLTNVRGTIAMARTGDPNSGTSEFFINTADNQVLDPGGGADPNGYAVFGAIRGSGMDVVDASYATASQNRGGAFASIPLRNYPQPPNGSFPTDTTIDNYEVVTDTSVVRRPDVNAPDSLTFSIVSNSNNNLVQASISNGKLVLDYVTGQTGSATIRLRATDADGASVETEFTVSVGQDTTAPTVTIASPPSGQPFATNPTIQGNATDNFGVANFEASVDGGTPQVVTVNPQGGFSFTPNVPTNGSAEGTHTVVFTAKDAAGNTSAPATFTFKMDNTAAAVTITSPADGQTFTGSPQITGTVTDANGVSTLKASLDGGTPQAVTFDAQGNFTFTPSTEAEGSHSVVFTSQDVAGNQSAPNTLTYTIARAEAVTITSPASGQSFPTAPTITGTVTSGVPDGGLQASVDGGAPETVPSDTNRNFSFTPSVSTEGQHTVTFSAGVNFASVQFTFRLDSTAPTVQVTSPANGQTFAANPQITGQASDAQGVSQVRVSVDGGADQTVPVDAQGGFTYTPAFATDGSADGQHTLSFVAQDAAGNVSSPAALTFTLDTAAPALAVTSPPSGSSLQTSPTITGTATDAVSLAGLTVSINGGTEQNVPVDNQGNFSFNPNFPTDGSADAYYDYVFRARDGAGRVTTVSHIVYLDTTRPVVTVTSPPDSQTFTSNPTINVSVTDNIGSGSAQVFVDGLYDRDVQFPTNTGFSFTPALATDGSANGPHTITFVAPDVAGNHSTPVDFHFTLNA